MDFKYIALIIWRVLFWITEVNAIYYAFLYITGLFLCKQKYPMQNDEMRFCIFVPCHNEGAVVASTVDNYVKINYDEKLFNIYFLADNCTDNTANLLRSAVEASGKNNFFVLERNDSDPQKRGKPHAIRWGIELLESKNQFYSAYDMFMILDADNFVDADILKHINSQYLSYSPKKRPAMIQVYLDSKNSKGWVARAYFANYRIFNTFLQMPKQKLGLVPTIGGTGYAVQTEFLKEIGGFNCTSLTEDLEIQAKATVKNRKIVYNHNTRIYDEKPTGLKQALVQRTRWAQGHWWVFFHYFPWLLVQLFNFKTFTATLKKLDMLVYLCVRLLGLCSVLIIPLNIYFMIFAPGLNSIPQVLSYANTVMLALSLFLYPLSSLYSGTPQEKKRVLLDFIPNMLAVYVMTAFDALASVAGLFKCGNQRVWKKTAHKYTELDNERESKLKNACKTAKERKKSKQKNPDVA